MSTIKSSAENLTLNADGANNDIIFQSNGSNVATLDQAGLLTATTFAGSGASLTALPAAQITGTHASFLSTGIDDNATAVKLTVSDDGININGNITSTGAGQGIYLGVAGAVAANLLDDYEEGTFTPTLTGSGSAASYTEQAGSYTKIGNLVHVTIKLACSKGTLSGGIYIDSLPFAAGVDTWGLKYDWYQPYGTAILETSAFFNSGASKLSMYGLTAANNDGTAQNFTDSWISGVAKFRLNFSYRT